MRVFWNVYGQGLRYPVVSAQDVYEHTEPHLGPREMNRIHCNLHTIFCSFEHLDEFPV